MGAYSLVRSRHELGQLVFYDSEYQQRWIDAIGPKVIKFTEDFAGDVALSAEGSWVTTQVIGGVSSYDVKGGAIRIWSDDSAGECAQIQKLHGFIACTACPIYFGVRWKLAPPCSATHQQILMGLHAEDTTALAGPDTGIVFEIATAATGLDMVCYKTGTGVTMEALTTVATDTWYTDEFYWDGANAIDLYHDGAYIGTASAGSISNTSAMCITLGRYTVGAAATAAAGLAVDWVRAIQLLDARAS